MCIALARIVRRAGRSHTNLNMILFDIIYEFKNIDMKNKYEMEILLDHSFEVLYHTFNNKDKWYEELQWIMNLEEGIPMKLITQIRIYEL